jgi:hypothetical protein
MRPREMDLSINDGLDASVYKEVLCAKGGASSRNKYHVKRP